MRKKHLYTMILLILVVFAFCSCNKNTKRENKHATEESETGGGVPIDPDKHTDFSEVRDDLSKLEEDEITEIYIYCGNKEYSTTDKEIIDQIKEQLLTVELEETNYDDILGSIGEMWTGDYILNLCSNDKVFYRVRFNGNAVLCGHGQYVAISSEGLYEALNIARRTFWRD